MKTIKKGTKKAIDIIRTFENSYKGGDIYAAYKTTPSYEKIRTFKEIENRAKETTGYNHDLKVVAASTWTYSTMYSFTKDGTTYIVYDTPSYTYITEY